MAEDIMETVKKRLKNGWIKTLLSVEVLAITEDAANSSLKGHIEKMKNVENVLIYKEDFGKTEKTSNPFKKDEDAYSKVVEVELIARGFENLVYLVLNYAPSSIEILEPTELKMKLGEAQSILNVLAELIHGVALKTRGAVTIDT